ncbi:hypothetical protein BASA83_000163 [Batrachochytrium salamandrivorans]|nr:hypothetical protein BASA62_000091 [Batrachochytrium salamandrivorans]KAH9277296.1 hypothetical protein BASA83_000163 [Batrachochytrium salamandrivorans]
MTGSISAYKKECVHSLSHKPQETRPRVSSLSSSRYNTSCSAAGEPTITIPLTRSSRPGRTNNPIVAYMNSNDPTSGTRTRMATRSSIATRSATTIKHPSLPSSTRTLELTLEPTLAPSKKLQSNMLPVKRAALQCISNNQPGSYSQNESAAKRSKRVTASTQSTTSHYSISSGSLSISEKLRSSTSEPKNDVAIAKHALRAKENYARTRVYSRPLARPAASSEDSRYSRLPVAAVVPSAHSASSESLVKCHSLSKSSAGLRVVQPLPLESVSFSNSVSSSTSTLTHSRNKYAHVLPKVNSWASSSIGSIGDMSGSTIVAGSIDHENEPSIVIGDQSNVCVDHARVSSIKSKVTPTVHSPILLPGTTNPRNTNTRLVPSRQRIYSDEDIVMEEAEGGCHMAPSKPLGSALPLGLSKVASHSVLPAKALPKISASSSASVLKHHIDTTQSVLLPKVKSAKAQNVHSSRLALTQLGLKLGTRDPVEMVTRLNKVTSSISKPLSVPYPNVCALMTHTSAPPRSKVIHFERDPNPLLVSEYAQDIYSHLLDMEVRTMPTHTHYMDIQPTLEWHMRTRLLCWIVQVHNRFRLVPETLFLTVNIIDRFLGVKQVSLEKLQLVGVTSLLIASKYEDRMAPSIADLVYMVDRGYQAEDILQAERFILGMLRFELGYPGPYGFMRRISAADGFDTTVRNLSKYILEVAMLDQRLLGIPPSHLAAGAMLLARKVAHNAAWTSEHVAASGYTEKALLDCVYLMLEDVRVTSMRGQSNSTGDSDKDIGVVYEKYSTDRYGMVSIHMGTFLRQMGLI